MNNRSPWHPQYTLELESVVFFRMKYFEDEVHNGNWDEVEKHLSGFTKVEDDSYSMKIFLGIRKQKYLEALDKHDRSQAVDILIKDLKFFATCNELLEEIAQLSTLENFRENEQLSKCGDSKSARAIMSVELKKLIEANPLFSDKLQFPNLKGLRLRTLINQGLNWQHGLCKNPSPNPVIKTLYVDHPFGQPNCAWAPSPANNPLLGIKLGAVKMLSLSMELVFLILQFLDEGNLKETIHKLKQESGVFFNMKYVKDEVHNGNWDEVEVPLQVH